MELHGKYVMIGEGVRWIAGQGADRQVQAVGRQKPAEVRPRHERAVGNQAGEPQAGPGNPHHGLAAEYARPAAARSCTTWKTTWSRSVSWCTLNYKNPHLFPYMEFQRFKHHPMVADAAAGRPACGLWCAGHHRGRLPVRCPSWSCARRARCLGCSAGMVNVPRIKGIAQRHALGHGWPPMRLLEAIKAGREGDELTAYDNGSDAKARSP